MDLDIKTWYEPVQGIYHTTWADLDANDNYEKFEVSEDDLLDYVKEKELNMITPNGQEDFEPYSINPKRALEQFEDEIIKHYIINQIIK